MSQQPTPNEQDRSPETVGDIAEVTFERIGEILDAEKLVYRNEEQEIPDGSNCDQRPAKHAYRRFTLARAAQYEPSG